jgi:hypothetical protein
MLIQHHRVLQYISHSPSKARFDTAPVPDLLVAVVLVLVPNQ